MSVRVRHLPLASVRRAALLAGLLALLVSEACLNPRPEELPSNDGDFAAPGINPPGPGAAGTGAGNVTEDEGEPLPPASDPNGGPFLPEAPDGGVGAGVPSDAGVLPGDAGADAAPAPDCAAPPGETRAAD